MGDKLDLYFEVSRYKRGFLFGKGTASVNGKPAVKAEIGIFMEQSESGEKIDRNKACRVCGKLADFPEG